MRKNIIPGLGLAFLIVCFDQVSKWWVVNYLTNSSGSIPITDFFNLVLTYNRGVSFGLFAANTSEVRWTLVGLTLSIATMLVWWLYMAKTQLSVFAFGIIIGGAIGNITDRIVIGAVVDFLDFYAFGFHWPAFNIADAAICSGAALLVFESLFMKNKLE